MNTFCFLLSFALCVRFAEAQELNFGKVRLSQTDTLYVPVTTTGSDYHPSVKVDGAGFSGPYSVQLLLHLDGYLRGTVAVTFTARYPGVFRGTLHIDIPNFPNQYQLTATVDSAAFPGVYADPTSYTQRDLRFPTSYCGYELRDRDTIRFANSKVSQGSLHIWPLTQSKYFTLLTGSDTIRIAPGDTGYAVIILDSQKVGSHSSTIKFGSNANNYEGDLGYQFRGQVLEPPKLEFAKSSLQLDSVDQVGYLAVRNSGTRMLTLDLPELSWPFRWLRPERNVNLACAGELARLDIILDTLLEGHVKHVYWLKTNAANVSDSILFVLESGKNDLTVVRMNEIAGLRLQGTRVTVSGSASVLETFSLLGQPLKRYALQDGETVDVNDNHVAVILLKLNIQGKFYIRKIMLSR